MYTMGIFKDGNVFEFDVDSGMEVDNVNFESVVVERRELTSWFCGS
jgi:hypothetical protein